MARGSYAKNPAQPAPDVTPPGIPLRATRQLPAVTSQEEAPETGPLQVTMTKALELVRPKQPIAMPHHAHRVIVDERRIKPWQALQRHSHWLIRFVACLLAGVIIIGVLLSAAMLQRPGSPQLVSFFGGTVYSLQVGGNLANQWQNNNNPLPPKVPIPAHPGPYSLLGKPTITPDFINQVLASYNSPAAGKGQALYDLGVKYGIDPVYALAFFMHESTFGTQGEAVQSRSLGNLRCIPNVRCQDNFAWFDTWEQGFEAWYALIRNLYIGYWGRVTVEQIIPRYAPSADNNDEAGYIAAVEHSVDAWHAGVLRP